MVKVIFEQSLKKNNTDKLNKCNLITKLLGIEDNSIDKIIEIYGNQVLEKQQRLISDIFDKIPTNYQASSTMDKYNYPFLEVFIQFLETIFQICEDHLENIYSIYQIQGTIKLLDRLINSIGGQFVAMIMKKIDNYFMIEKQILQKISQDADSADPTDADVLDKSELLRVNSYCVEISNISNQFYQFSRHLTRHFIQVIKANSKNIFQKDAPPLVSDEAILNEPAYQQFTAFLRQCELNI